MAFIRKNDVSLHYRADLKAGRPVIAFVNSLGTDFRIWDAVIEQLGGQFGVVLADKRGHGLSELGHAPETIETYTSDLKELLDHLGIGRVTICGLSIGGLVAQCFALNHPERVERLVLCDTAAKIGSAESWDARISATSAEGIESFADDVMTKWFTPAFHRERNAELAGCRVMLSRQSPAGYVAACRAVRDADYRSAVPFITVPTLVVCGDQDGSTPPQLVRGLADSIPGALFELIENAAHIPCVEQPASLSRLIREFMSNDVP